MESVAICQHNTTNSDTEELWDVVFFGLSENSSELIRMHYMQISYSVAELIYGVHLYNVIFRIKWFVSKVKHLNNTSHIPPSSTPWRHTYHTEVTYIWADGHVRRWRGWRMKIKLAAKLPSQRQLFKTESSDTSVKPLDVFDLTSQFLT